LSWWGDSGSQRRRMEDDILRDSVDRNGCEGALILCQQVEPERDCYRRVERECRRLYRRLNSGEECGEGEEGSTDSEPGPSMY
jgi:hypothetical protein